MNENVKNKLLSMAQKEYDVIAKLFFELSKNDTTKLGKYKYLYLQDVVDLVKFYGLILNEQFKKAQYFGQDLDTDVRKRVPAYIHNNLIEVENL